MATILEYGLDVDLKLIASSAQVVPALIAGDINLASMSAGETVEASLAGHDTILISGDRAGVLFSVMSKPSITKIEDLKGKKVGITKLMGSPDIALRLALPKVGLDANKDVTVISAGATIADIFTALAAGAIDAGVISPPFTFAAKKQGFYELISIAEMEIPYIGQGVNTTKAYIANNKETVRKFMKGYIEGIARFKQDKEFAKKVLGKYSQVEDQDELEASYNYVAKSLRSAPYVPREGIETMLGFSQNPNAKTAKAEDFYDNSFVKELDDSGFIKGLSK